MRLRGRWRCTSLLVALVPRLGQAVTVSLVPSITKLKSLGPGFSFLARGCNRDCCGRVNGWWRNPLGIFGLVRSTYMIALFASCFTNEATVSLNPGLLKILPISASINASERDQRSLLWLSITFKTLQGIMSVTLSSTKEKKNLWWRLWKPRI